VAAPKATWFASNPAGKFRDLGMSPQLLDGVESPFQLFLGQDFVDLGMAGSANSDNLPHRHAIEIAFVSLVMMPCARNQVVARERLFAFANRARRHEYKYSS
jgi:hypothetical protein